MKASLINRIKRYKKLPFNLILKKIIVRLYRSIYFKFREVRIKNNPITMDCGIFSGWNSGMKFLFNNDRQDYYIKEIDEFDKTEEIIRQADKIVDHVFDLLGSGDINLGCDIKWNQDFKSGFIWENEFYKKIKLIDLSNNADVKVPWELSRFQHIPVLGQAYWITKDEKYAEEFKNQIEDWIKKNPVEMSVNWTSAMDVAIRACNWIVGVNYFKESKISECFWDLINKWLYLHGNFIFYNLEKNMNTNNHYLTNLAGLVWLGMYFRDLRYDKNSADNWLKYGIEELEIEVKKQVYADGFDYEAATYYHCLVTELLLYTTILCDCNGIHFSQIFRQKLEKMCVVILNITKPDGNIPLIGDMDNGRFLVLSGYGSDDIRDFRYLLGVAAEYFDRDDFRIHSLNHTAALWMFKELKEPRHKHHIIKSASYPQGGFHVLRDKKIYIIIRCGKNGTGGSGSHTHNDQLSFELNYDSEDFIVDPGVFVYTADYKMRNLFRSTKSHNTIQVGEMEQNDFYLDYLSGLEDETNAELANFYNNFFQGRHYGYLNKVGVIHERIIIVNSNLIEIKDKFIHKLNSDKENAKIPPAKMSFVLDSDVKITTSDNIISLTKKRKSIYIMTANKYKFEKAWIAKKYGKLLETKKLVISADYDKLNVTKIAINIIEL